MAAKRIAHVIWFIVIIAAVVAYGEAFWEVFTTPRADFVQMSGDQSQPVR